MNKQLIVYVSSAFTGGSGPNAFGVSITEGLATRIRELAKAVVELGVYSITEVFSGGVWSSEGLAAEELHRAGASFTQMDEVIAAGASTVDRPMLSVMEEGFRFIAVEVGQAHDCDLESEVIPLSELDDSDTAYIAL